MNFPPLTHLIHWPLLIHINFAQWLSSHLELTTARQNAPEQSLRRPNGHSSEPKKPVCFEYEYKWIAEMHNPLHQPPGKPASRILYTCITIFPGNQQLFARHARPERSRKPLQGARIPLPRDWRFVVQHPKICGRSNVFLCRWRWGMLCRTERKYFRQFGDVKHTSGAGNVGLSQ